MTEQTMAPWERESAIRQEHHKRFMRRANKWVIASGVGFAVSFCSLKFTNENPYADNPAVLAYASTNRDLFHLKNYQQNTQSIPSLDQLLPEDTFTSVTTTSSLFHTSLEAHVASLEQTAAKLQQHPDVLQYHDQASQNTTNTYFIGGAALGLCLVAFARVLQLGHQTKKSIQIELAALRASEPL